MLKDAEETTEFFNFKDLFKKLEYDLNRFEQNNHPYIFIDCLLSLNALPEWLYKQENIHKEFKLEVKKKIDIMKEKNFSLDLNKIEVDIDHQLRFIRVISNHSKHKKKPNAIPKIITVSEPITFPIILPAYRKTKILIGDVAYDAKTLVKNVYNFWKNKLEYYQMLD